MDDLPDLYVPETPGRDDADTAHDEAVMERGGDDDEDDEQEELHSAMKEHAEETATLAELIKLKEEKDKIRAVRKQQLVAAMAHIIDNVLELGDDENFKNFLKRERIMDPEYLALYGNQDLLALEYEAPSTVKTKLTMFSNWVANNIAGVPTMSEKLRLYIGLTPEVIAPPIKLSEHLGDSTDSDDDDYDVPAAGLTSKASILQEARRRSVSGVTGRSSMRQAKRTSTAAATPGSTLYNKPKVTFVNIPPSTPGARTPAPSGNNNPPNNPPSVPPTGTGGGGKDGSCFKSIVHSYLVLMYEYWQINKKAV